MTRGESIKNCRIRRGLSLSQLAELSGISVTILNALESDRSSNDEDILRLLGSVLDLDTDTPDLVEEAVLIAAYEMFNISPIEARNLRRCFRHILRDLHSMVYECVQDEAHIRHAQLVISNKIKSIIGEE